MPAPTQVVAPRSGLQPSMGIPMQLEGWQQMPPTHSAGSGLFAAGHIPGTGIILHIPDIAPPVGWLVGCCPEVPEVPEPKENWASDKATEQAITTKAVWEAMIKQGAPVDVSTLRT
mmetsp:Transcript_101896/g.183831  ORF Transcript_101896/g.183831 Transcript_101896/m.183831 type:complete len:116 (-) Transcript_101896:63-410(-)